MQGTLLFVLIPLLADLLPARSWWEDVAPHPLWDACPVSPYWSEVNQTGRANENVVEGELIIPPRVRFARSNYFWPLFIADLTT